MSQLQGAFVLVHGGHAGAWVWDELRALLEHTSLTVDLPGHGIRAGDLATLTIDQCVRAILPELPPDKRLTLIGHSLGAAIVLALADRIAARVAHVVCLAGPVPRPGDSIVASFPFLMRVASRVVMWFSRGEFAQLRRMSEATFFNGIDPGWMKRACERLRNESAALAQEPVRWSGRPPFPAPTSSAKGSRPAFASSSRAHGGKLWPGSEGGVARLLPLRDACESGGVRRDAQPDRTQCQLWSA
jgi:pimeloyl-ACP methyl ester carboxylesterase